MVKDKENETNNKDDDSLEKQVANATASLEGLDDDKFEYSEGADAKDGTKPTDDTQNTKEATKPASVSSSGKKDGRFKRFIRTKKGKALLILLALLTIIGVLYAVPATRYGILGNVIKKSVHVVVMDSSTMKPVSEAEVSLGGAASKTDKKGEATLESVRVGEYNLKITKGYYKVSETSYTVPVLGDSEEQRVSLKATGRQVTMTVTNKITGAALTGASVKVSNTSALADDKGAVTIVLPADKKILDGTVSLDGYNESAVKIDVSDQSKKNQFALTPAGDVYYLSKQTGKLNVMKSKLDGTGSSVVVEGTGNENDGGSVLLAARDWNYMALSAKRSADPKKTGQLYLVDAKSGGLKTIDEGDADFQLVGWSGHKFIYTVTRNDFNVWDSKIQKLKSYDADTGKLSVIDEIEAQGSSTYDYAREQIISPYILENKIVYVKNVYRAQYGKTDVKSAIMSINPDGSRKQRVKEFDAFTNIQSRLYEPQEVYFRVTTYDNSTPTYYEYENSTLKSISNTDAKFSEAIYPTYLVSPNGAKTFWHEPRDGKNTLLVGDKDGKDGKTLASQSDYTTYGWYGDGYVLLSKNESELYIASSDKEIGTPLKITNFHKPQLRYPGYGYGYGGN